MLFLVDGKSSTVFKIRKELSNHYKTFEFLNFISNIASKKINIH